MCGITGLSFVAGTNRNVAEKLQFAVTAISHRGPDDQGTFIDHVSGIALGHTRLSIQDLSLNGHQPMLTDDKRIALVFNGEIYNFRNLRADLVKAGHSFHSHSDTEVLLHLYIEHGESMLPMLNGIFAFALWDARIEKLLLARDALGVKPLYFHEGEDSFAFSSEVKSLREMIPGVGEIDHVSLHRYLSFLWCPGDGTPTKGIRKLTPGQAIWIRKGKIEKQYTWYQLPTFRSTPTKMSEGEAVDGTVFHLRQAVHRQMVADVDVGAFLSGGLDSSSIVAFARDVCPEIRCFTIDSGGAGKEGIVDDLPYAKRVADHLGVRLDVVKIDSSKMALDLESMVVQLDEPLADPAPLNVLYISRLARENGIKVLLSGAGGDDLFTGYRRHYAVIGQPYFDCIPKFVLRATERATRLLNQRNPVFRRLTKLFNGSSLEGDERLINYFLWSRRSDLLRLYSPSFLAALGDAAAETPLLDFVAPLPKSIDSISRILALEQRFFLSDHNLMYTDKMSMAVGVEVRVPFLDLDLVEFASRIPSPLKQRGSQGKWVLKKAMEPYLPHDVIYRPKSGFGAPLRHWMRFELKELLGDLLSETSIARRGLFNPKAVQQLISDNDTGRMDASYTLLSLLCIEIWFRNFADRPAL